MKETTPSSQVIEAIARREGISATELSPPLYDVVDTDALDALLSGESTRENGSLRISFEYRGYDVSVESGNVVEVSLRSAPTGSSDSQRASGRSARTPD
jgi:hypothetical protein